MELTLSEFYTNYARRVVQRVFQDYPGSPAVRLWDGQTLTFGKGMSKVCLDFRHQTPIAKPSPFIVNAVHRQPLLRRKNSMNTVLSRHSNLLADGDDRCYRLNRLVDVVWPTTPVDGASISLQNLQKLTKE